MVSGNTHPDLSQCLICFIKGMADHGEPELPEWGPGKTARGRARLLSSRRRERPMLSWSLCRQRKWVFPLETDSSNMNSNILFLSVAGSDVTESSHGNCADRGLGLSCTYTAKPIDGHQRRPNIHYRIEQLESLVISLMETASASTSAQATSAITEHHDSPVTARDRSFAASPYADHAKSNSTASDCGSLQLTQSSTKYVNSAHWAAVLDGIADLRDYLDEEGEVQDDTPLDELSLAERSGPQLLYGCARPVTKEEILASIPERPVVDRLISCYFNSFDMSPG